MRVNKIKSAVLEKNQKVTVKDLPQEKLLSLECEVKIEAAGLCSSDISRGYGGTSYFYPLVMGHEMAGEITKIGSGVKNHFHVGDKVCVFPLIPCFNCIPCKQKLYALCKDYSYYGSRKNGGFAERLNVNHWNLLKIPDGVNIEDCALIEPTTVALHAVEKLNITNEEKSKVCILGAGFIGLIAVQIIKRLYPKCEVIITDRNQYKLNIGSNYGASTKLVNDQTSWEFFLLQNANSFDNIIELVGSPETYSAALEIASHGATIVWAGNISENLKLEKSQVSSILRKELTILGTWNSIFKGKYSCDWEKAIELIANGLKPSELVTSRISLDEIDKTLEKLYEHKSRKSFFKSIKILVNPNG
jgi:L-iditol 2-dehydrogenase